MHLPGGGTPIERRWTDCPSLFAIGGVNGSSGEAPAPQSVTALHTYSGNPADAAYLSSKDETGRRRPQEAGGSSVSRASEALQLHYMRKKLWGGSAEWQEIRET